MHKTLLTLVCALMLMNLSCAQVNFSPSWGKRGVSQEGCKASMDSLLYLYKLVQDFVFIASLIMDIKKRTSVGSKGQLKEKIVEIYEDFFRGNDLVRTYPNIWNEFFLLKPKITYFETEMQRLNAEQLGMVQDNLRTLFSQCIETLNHQHNIRVVYALQTLCVIVNSTYRKSQNDAMNLLMGINAAEIHMQQLIHHFNIILSGEYPSCLKSLCLKVLLIFVTGSDNVSSNFLLEYVMMNSVYETLIEMLCDNNSRAAHGSDVVSLLTLLINYRKHEAANPYIVKLSILDDELALNGYGQVITWSLGEFCHQFSNHKSEPQSVSWLTSLSSMVGNMFIADDINNRTLQIRANNGVLLALYEAVHLNRNFVSTLVHSQTETSALSSLSYSGVTGDITETTQPSNLLVTFLQYCSIIMQDNKSEGSMNNMKLCFIILTCIAEDQYANSLMHDVNLLFKVHLHRLPMRHRKFAIEKASQPLAYTLMDLLVEFIMSHMMKQFSLELYLQCIGIIHRVICYQKRCRVRLTYQWKELWAALITLLKFILANQSHLSKKINIFLLGLQVVNIFNLFITYGDTFLPSPSSYDELYYELIRMRHVFDNIYLIAFRYSTLEGEFKDTALLLTNSLVNVRAIINHFTPKINAWLECHALSTPSEDEILEVVRKNYESLTLKLQDSLDQYERYSENPTHSPFFTAMVRSVVIDIRQNIDYASLDLQEVLQELSYFT